MEHMHNVDDVMTPTIMMCVQPPVCPHNCGCIKFDIYLFLLQVLEELEGVYVCVCVGGGGGYRVGGTTTP